MEKNPDAVPLLSLYVPTYNRAALLSQALQAILSQITLETAPLVEVLVVDNASTDATPAVVQKAQADFPHVPFQYIRRPVNIGADRSLTDSPNLARGEFVYMLSDDDILLPGAAARLLELIQAHPELDAIALNVSHFTEDPADQDMQVGFPLTEDKIIQDKDQALLLFGSHLTFLSSMAFRRATVAGTDYSLHCNTLFAQAYLFLDVLLPARGLYVTSRRYLAMRQDNAQGYSVFRILITNFSHLMRHARRLGYSAEAVQKVLDQHLLNVYQIVLTLKSSGIGTLKPHYGDGLIRVLRAYGLKRFVLLRFIPRLLAPSRLLLAVPRLRRILSRASAAPSVD